MRRVLPFMLLLPLIFLFAGCAEEGTETSAVSPPAKKAISPPSSGDISPIEDAAAPEPPRYRYDPGGRDPFESLLEIKKPVLAEEKLTPLQKFDIAQLRLIGVIVGKGMPTALVVAPDGKSYVLKKGIKVGKNDGTVIEVNQDAVLVEESYIDFSGEVRTVVQEIMLPKREGVE